MRFLDQNDINRIAHLQVRVRYVVEGALAGLHASSQKGHSLEFAQHREYAPGDELRRIDWKVFGRADRFFVKQYQDETNLRAYIALDASGSMGFAAGGRMTKLAYGTTLAAALAYLLLRQGDAAGLGVFDESFRFSVPAAHQLAHLERLFGKLEDLAAGGETDLAAVLADLGRHIRRRSLVVVISDLMGDAAGVARALRYIRSRHHEVIVLQVLDPDEIRFPYEGERSFVHLENGERVPADAGAIAREYRRAFDRFLAGYTSAFRQAGIAYHRVTTEVPLDAALGRCLAGGGGGRA
jgi:uncharacterized protein (DUF58 family)